MTDLWLTLADIPAEGLALALNIPAEEMAALAACGGGAKPDLTGPLSGEIRVSSSGGRLRLRGSFSAPVRLSCDRCLNEFVAPLGGRIDELLELGPSAGEEPLDEEADGSLAVIEGRVDLSGLLAELFWLAWPFQALCRPDCRGLCPRCGSDLNEGPCACLSGGPH